MSLGIPGRSLACSFAPSERACERTRGDVGSLARSSSSLLSPFSPPPSKGTNCPLDRSLLSPLPPLKQANEQSARSLAPSLLQKKGKKEKKKKGEKERSGWERSGWGRFGWRVVLEKTGGGRGGGRPGWGPKFRLFFLSRPSFSPISEVFRGIAVVFARCHR